MGKKFSPLTVQEESLLSKEEIIRYYDKKTAYYKNAPINTLYLKFVKAIKSGLIKEAAKMSDFKIVYLNDLEMPESGYIIATNHKGFNDIPALVQIIEEPFFLMMANDIPFPPKTKLLMFLIGAITFSRLNRKEKQAGLERASKISARGYNTAFYPEAVNNFTDSVMLYPFWNGIIYNAKNSNKPILPIATFDKDNKMYVKFGKPFRVNPYDNADIAASILRDEIAALRWDILESFPLMTREEGIKAYQPPILTSDNMTFAPEYETKFVYRPKNPYSPTGERLITLAEVSDIKRNIEIGKSAGASEMTFTDYKDFDIKSAGQELKEEQLKRKHAYESQINNYKYEGKLRLIKRKTIT